ncbi:ABC transporter substrate-binding protein [Paenibacillus sp. MWE-103]|uniref:ABC transporter substrate-binding protein n=2 Tax=Paenibacillus artemisiicola TaxID=1172618 RepID=A0ABS3WGK6_9BACL|nr:ABC transporter substrate-binding protein [Paenibacillus artemisiicola]
MAFVLSACSGGGDSGNAANGGNGGAGAGTGKKQTITVWHGAGGEGGKFLDGLVKEYNDSQSAVQVKLVFVDPNTMVQKLTAAAAGKALPDAGLLMWPQWAGPLKDVILPLDEKIAAEPDKWKDSDFLDNLLDGNVRFGGVTYGFPMETNNLALYYNKKLFAEANVQPPATWDELVAAAQKLTNPSKKQWGIELPTTKGGTLDFIWDTFLWQAGGEYANPEGTDILFNSDAGEQATQLWVDLVNKYKAASIAPPQNGFQTGLIAMTLTGPWSIPGYKAAKLDFGVVPLPAGPSGKATSLGGTNNFIFKSTPEKENAAWDFLTWLASPEISAKFAAGYGSIPVRQSAAEQKAWTDFVASTPEIKVHQDSYAFGKIRPYNLTTYAEISDIVSEHIEAALQNKETPETAMKKAYDESKPLVKTWVTP